MSERRRRYWLLGTLLLVAACQSQPPTEPGVSRAEEREKVAAVNTQLGIEFIRTGPNELALKKLQKALEAVPNYPDAHNALGLLYNRMGEYDKADASFRAALRTSPTNGLALNNYGQFLCQQKRYAEGQSRFLAAVKNPLYESPEIAYTNAGLCALDAGDAKAAEDHFRAALERNPNVPPALISLASLSLDRGDAVSAAQFFKRYSDDARQTPRSLALGIRIERALGHQDQVASYEVMLRNQFPDSREAGQLQRGEL